MKKSDIYEIAIKFLGLYLVVPLINQIQEVLSFSSVLLQYSKDVNMFGGIDPTSYLITSLLNSGFLIFLIWLLLFRTRKIAQLICTDEDYKEKIEIHASKSQIFEIALTLTGLIVIVWSIPEFIVSLKNYMQFEQMGMDVSYHDMNFLYILSGRILIGTLVVIFAKKISLFLIKGDN